MPWRVWGEKVPSSIKPEDFRLKFQTAAPKLDPATYPKLPRGFPRPATKADIAKAAVVIATSPQGIQPGERNA